MTNITVSDDGRSSSHHYGQHDTATLDEVIDKALAMTGGDPDRAGALFGAWAERSSEIRGLLPDLVSEFVRRRIRRRASGKQARDEEVA